MAKQVVFPTYGRAAGRGPLLSRYVLNLCAISLIKIDGVWTEVIMPSQELIETVGQGNFFIGGHIYQLTDAEAAASGLPAQYLEDV